MYFYHPKIPSCIYKSLRFVEDNQIFTFVYSAILCEVINNKKSYAQNPSGIKLSAAEHKRETESFKKILTEFYRVKDFLIV